MSDAEPDSSEWAIAQQREGARLQEEGEAQACPDSLRRAIESYRNALTGVTLVSGPYDYADIQYDLAMTYWSLLELGASSAVLPLIDEAFQEALKGFEREADSDDWARTQYNFGLFLRQSGSKLGRLDMLERAIIANRAAMKAYDKLAKREDWCRAAHNLAIALKSLTALRGDGTAYLFEACDLLEQVLQEPVYADNRQYWAMSQVVYGGASQLLGERRDVEALMERAVAAYDAALSVRSRETTPVEWANALSQKGISLHVLGERRGDTSLLEDAIAAHRAALTVRTPDTHLHDHAHTQADLGNALSILGWLKREGSILERALAAFTTSIEAFNQVDDPSEASFTEDDRRKAVERLAKLAQ